jgi:hypothetical protein
MPRSLSLTTIGRSVVYDGINHDFKYCAFRVNRFVYVEVSQQTFLTRFLNWKAGSFEEAFPDLARAGHDLETLELDDMERFVSNEAAKGTEVFEAFGMKFPAGQITLWGMVILLGVQLYFFVYLKQLSGKLEPTAAGWDVPWVGMNPSVLARLMFILTVLVLPCLAMSLLANHAVSVLERPVVWRSLSATSALAVDAALIPAAALAMLSWKYRPKAQDAASLTAGRPTTGAPDVSTTTLKPTRTFPDSNDDSSRVE